MRKHLCAVCGREHDEIEPAFRRPDALFAVPKDERAGRARESDDLVAIDDVAFFIRCVAPIPVKGREAPYGWGFWVKVAERDFGEYRRFFDEDPPRDHPGFLGTLANQTRLLPPTLGLPVHVHLGRGSQRPRLMLLDDAHPLTRQQEEGLTAADVHALSERCTDDDAAEAPPGPGRPPFRPTLEEEGWLVAEPGDVECEPEPLASAPAPGDLVKAPFVFLAADAHGAIDERVELMWVELDDVRADGWWGGTLNNHPFVPGTLDAGTRVWLRAEHVLAHEPAG
jgi:hypothetical protein